MSASPAPDDDGPVEAALGLPARRRVVAPLPLAVRRARALGRTEPVREWAPVGTVAAGVLADVDPAGLVCPVGARWSLDWWTGAEDRWHHPSTDAAVRQSPLGAAPVVSTSMRVPGGDVVHRVGGVVADAGEWSGPAVLVEVENLSAVPVALALVVRPWTLDGRGAVHEVSVDGDAVVVDGVPAVLLSRPAARAVTGTSESVAPALADGRDEDAATLGPARGGADGDLEVAVVVPLPHSATVRALLPASPPPQRPRGRRSRVAVPATPWSAPELASVVSGWAAHRAGGVEAAPPLPASEDLLAWSGSVVHLAGPGEVTRSLDPAAAPPDGPPWGTRVTVVAEALAGIAADEANDAVAAALVRAQRFSGEVRVADGSDATPALLWTAAAVMAGPRGSERAAELVGPVAKGIRSLRRRGPARSGDPTGDASAALRRVAAALVRHDQPGVAADALAVAGAWDGEPADPPARAVDGGSTLAARLAVRAAVAAGDVGAVADLSHHLAERGVAGRPDAVDPEGRPVGSTGFDVAELAALRLAILDALVRDDAAGPVLLPCWPEEWRGREVEVGALPTGWGSVSFALRWHGERPALLWEVDPLVGRTDGRSAPVLTAPGLDPHWSAASWTGEALLAAPEPPGAPERGGAGPAGEGESFA